MVLFNFRISLNYFTFSAHIVWIFYIVVLVAGGESKTQSMSWNMWKSIFQCYHRSLWQYMATVDWKKMKFIHMTQTLKPLVLPVQLYSKANGKLMNAVRRAFALNNYGRKFRFSSHCVLLFVFLVVQCAKLNFFIFIFIVLFLWFFLFFFSILFLNKFNCVVCCRRRIVEFF